MIWVDGLHYSPMAFLLMSAAFRGMDPALEESSLMCGAGLPHVVAHHAAARVTGRRATFLILFVRALESFEVPALIGLPAAFRCSRHRSTQAMQHYPSQVGLASAYSVTLLADHRRRL